MPPERFDPTPVGEDILLGPCPPESNTVWPVSSCAVSLGVSPDSCGPRGV